MFQKGKTRVFKELTIEMTDLNSLLKTLVKWIVGVLNTAERKIIFPLQRI